MPLLLAVSGRRLVVVCARMRWVCNLDLAFRRTTPRVLNPLLTIRAPVVAEWAPLLDHRLRIAQILLRARHTQHLQL